MACMLQNYKIKLPTSCQYVVCVYHSYTSRLQVTYIYSYNYKLLGIRVDCVQVYYC